jgi:AraC-like DNA-binding protein
MFSIQVYQPSADLAPYIACYSSGVLNTNAERNTSFKIVPNGCMELIVHLKEQYCQLPAGKGLQHTPDYMLIGLFPKCYQITFDESVPIFSIRFKAEAISLLLGLQGSELLESYEDIDLLFDNTFRDLCYQIREENSMHQRIERTENFLLSLLSKRDTQANYVYQAASMIRNWQVSSMQELSQSVCISQRQLERKFKKDIGISPKHFLRLTRINKVIRILQLQESPIDLTSLAYFSGYYDQAHFIKDFKDITGQPPSIYMNEKQKFIYLPPHYL